MEYFLEIAGVRLRAVVDEDLVDVEMDAAGEVVVLQNGFAQEWVALLGAIPMKAVGRRQLIYGLVHRLHDSRAEGLADVADAEGDDVALGVGHLEGVHLLCNVGKQVVVLEVKKMYVY